MKKAAIQIAVLAGILLVVCIGCRLAMGDTYVAYIPMNGRQVQEQGVRLSVEAPQIVAPGTPELHGDALRIPIKPQRAGRTFIDMQTDDGTDLGLVDVRVGRFGTIYDNNTGGFTGDTIALAAFTVFCLTVAAIMLHTYRAAKGTAFYAYSTIYAAGFSLFALLTGLLMLWVTARKIVQPGEYLMLSAYNTITAASWHFVSATAPLLVAFAAAMSVSNVALLRHEGFRLKNVLGIGVGVALVAGEALAYWIYSRDFMGSEWEWRVRSTLANVYATVFAYCECMLIGAIVCGVKAARHVPAADADYILILGCRFRKDGTLTPLLKGRVDKAVEFWNRVKKTAGREAVLMPSGGQGGDESMPEAEAMRRYLLAQAVPERCIVAEDRSRNTFQNMAFSRALIERDAPGAKVVYVTTNYHVFRSGVWAALAGLPAEGLGSRTKWWYWPNAFMRECAGLLRNRIWQELALLIAMIAFFGALSMALG